MKFRWRRAALAAAALSLAVVLTACGGKLPGGVTSGLGELGGLTVEEAQSKLTSAFEEQVAGQTFTLSYGGASASLPGSVFQLEDTAGALEDADSSTPVPLSVTLTSEGEQVLEQVLEQLSEKDTVVNTTCTVENDALQVVKGTSGISLLGDSAQARQQVLDWVNAGVNGGTLDPLTLTGAETEPGDPDLETLYNDVYTEPVDAKLDAESGELVAHQNGLSFDIAAVRQEIDGLAEGEQATIPLTVTEPAITTQKLEANLFKDVLGEASSYISGSSNRLSNIKLAASMCNNLILMPGDIFAYNEITGPRTLAAGFLNAPAYVGGKTEDQVGGGICQVSSTTYYAVLLANLKVVERQNHSYAVGYVPDGMDATVYYGSLDFRFENDTNYPIKIVYTVDGRNLTVKILGTNESGYTYKVWNKVLSTTAPSVIEEEDPSLPAGESVVEQTAYTGKTVEVYRDTYDANGNKINTEKVNTSVYKKRDKIVRVGPAAAPTETTAPVETTPVSTSTPVLPVETKPVPTTSTAPETTPVPTAPQTTPPTTVPETSAPTVPETTPVTTPPAVETPATDVPAPPPAG